MDTQQHGITTMIPSLTMTVLHSKRKLGKIRSRKKNSFPFMARSGQHSQTIRGIGQNQNCLILCPSLQRCKLTNNPLGLVLTVLDTYECAHPLVTNSDCYSGPSVKGGYQHNYSLPARLGIQDNESHACIPYIMSTVGSRFQLPSFKGKENLT